MAEIADAANEELERRLARDRDDELSPTRGQLERLIRLQTRTCELTASNGELLERIENALLQITERLGPSVEELVIELQNTNAHLLELRK